MEAYVGPVKSLVCKGFNRKLGRIERMGVHVPAVQCIEYRFPALQGNLAFGRASAQQNSNFSKFLVIQTLFSGYWIVLPDEEWNGLR
jgi:hypothetical protein